MKEYHKINSVYKRDPATKRFIEGEWSIPEFGYLSLNEWVGEEKIDGMNIRVIPNRESRSLIFRGKTDNASIPTPLLERLNSLLSFSSLERCFFGDGSIAESVCLYGEGCGVKIQKSGGLYTNNYGQDFILFDIRVGEWWLARETVREISASLGVRCAKEVFRGSLFRAIEVVQSGLASVYGGAQAEGLVLRPVVDLFSRSGSRIITKVKCRDFQNTVIR